MLRRPFLAFTIAGFALCAPAGFAQSAPPAMQAQVIAPDAVLGARAPELRALLGAMGLYDILAIMAAEGRESAPDLEADMFPGQGGAAWMAVVAGIYATDKMTAAFEAALPVERLSDADIASLRAFFENDLGARIAAGEIAARQAFLDPSLEQIATDLAEERAAQNHPRIAQLTAAESRLVASWSSPASLTARRTDPPGIGRFLIKVGGRPGIEFMLRLTDAERAANVHDTNQRWAR